jgi:hypothetical protein
MPRFCLRSRDVPRRQLVTPLAPRITGADRATRTGAFVATLGDKPIRNALLEAA